MLKDSRGETQFVTNLLTSHLGQAADAILIMLPKVMLSRKIPLELLRVKGAAKCPIFYLNYSADPTDEPWRYTICSALKAYSRAVSSNISGPAEFGLAMENLLARSRTLSGAAAK